MTYCIFKQFPGAFMNVKSIAPLLDSTQLIPLLTGCAAAGFANPAEDYYEPPISLDDLLNIRAAHVWIVQLEGISMRGAGLMHGCRLIVDRSITAMAGMIVLAYVDNQPLVKRLENSGNGWILVSEHPDYKPIKPDDYQSIEVFGVVTWNINKTL